MVSGYSLTLDIFKNDAYLSEEDFAQAVQPCLAYLYHLNLSFRQSPSKAKFYPPGTYSLEHVHAVRVALVISVGKERGVHLLKLYEAIARLIQLELPDCVVVAKSDVHKFS